MPQLDPTWFASQLFWLFISFFMLYFVIAKVAVPPLMGIAAKRKQTVDEDLSLAQSLKTQAESARENYERTLAEARSRSQQLIDDAMQAQKAQAEKTSQMLDKQIAAKLAEATQRINSSKITLMENLTPTTTELTQLIVEKLISSPPNSDKVRNVIGGITKMAS